MENLENSEKKGPGKKEFSAPDPLLISDHESAKEVAKQLITDYHPHLASANIIYLCRSKAQKQGGKKLFGSVKKASPIERHIGGGYFPIGEEADFIMMIALDVWNVSENNQRTAMIDHLLTRCCGEEDDKTGHMRYFLQAPSVQEFAEIANRHGMWNSSLEEFAGNIRK
jgi:hypothetical protein